AADDPLRRTDGFRVTGPRRKGTAPVVVEDNYGQTDLTLYYGSGLVSVTSGDAQFDVDGFPPARIWRDGRTVHAVAGGLSLALAARPLSEARVNARAEGFVAGQIVAPLAGLVTGVY